MLDKSDLQQLRELVHEEVTAIVEDKVTSIVEDSIPPIIESALVMKLIPIRQDINSIKHDMTR